MRLSLSISFRCLAPPLVAKIPDRDRSFHVMMEPTAAPETGQAGPKQQSRQDLTLSNVRWCPAAMACVWCV